MNQNTVETLIKNRPDAGRDYLIPLLQDIQEAEGFLSKTTVLEVARALNLPASKIYGVATFYNQFCFQPKGKYHIQICRGTACHVKGSGTMMDRIERELKIAAGETTRDGLFSLEIVACIGACGLAPVISVNGEFHGNLDPDDIPKIIQSYRKQNHEESGHVESNP